MWKLFSTCAIALTLTSNPAAAKQPKVKVSGKIFTHFEKELTAIDHANAFHVGRAYVTAKATIDKNFSARITTDVGHLKNSDDTKVRPFLKYAYLEWKSVLPGMKLLLGMAGNGWTGYADKFAGIRYITKSFTDRRKQIASADIGLHAKGKALNKALTYQLALVNGEGYGKPEDDDTKSAQLRLTYNVLGAHKNALPVSVFVTQEFGNEEEPLTQYAAGLGFKSKPATLWGEFYGRQKGEDRGSGFSVTALPKLGKIGHLIARFDQWDFSTLNNDDKGQMMLAGLGRNYGKKVKVALVFEHENRNEDDPTQTVSIRLQAGF